MVGAPRQQGEGLGESPLDGMMLLFQTQVPFPRHERQVAPFLQQLWQRHDTAVQVTFVAGLPLVRRRASREFMKLAQSGNVMVRPGHQHGPGG